jgi:hypothetical protein
VEVIFPLKEQIRNLLMVQERIRYGSRCQDSNSSWQGSCWWSRKKELPVASKNAKQKPESEITGGGENSVTGGSDLSLNWPDKEVTNGTEETKDGEAGAKTATAVDNEVNHGVEEIDDMVASEKPNKDLSQKLLQQ